MTIISKLLSRKSISDFGYYFLILFLTYVFVNKVIDIPAFNSNIFKTGLYSSEVAKIMAYLVLIIELLNILFLLFSKKKGLFISLGMFLIFTIYITFLNFTNRYEVCGCGGVLNGLSFEKHLFINLGLVILTLISINFSYENKASFDN